METKVGASRGGASPAMSDRPRELVVELPALLSVGSARWQLVRCRLYADTRTNRFRAYAELVELDVTRALEPGHTPRGVQLAGEGRSVSEAVFKLAAELQSSPLLEPVQ